MPALYPSQPAAFVKKVDLQSIVYAADINEAYDEIIATQSAIGLDPANGGVWGSASFNSTTTQWGTVASRIKNVENGVFYLNTNAVLKVGGSTITPSSASTVGLNIRAASSQTANLFEVRDSSNSVIANITSAGAYVGVIDGGTA
jgi:hypothetical protein